MAGNTQEMDIHTKKRGDARESKVVVQQETMKTLFKTD